MSSKDSHATKKRLEEISGKDTTRVIQSLSKIPFVILSNRHEIDIDAYQVSFQDLENVIEFLKELDK